MSTNGCLPAEFAALDERAVRAARLSARCYQIPRQANGEGCCLICASCVFVRSVRFSSHIQDRTRLDAAMSKRRRGMRHSHMRATKKNAAVAGSVTARVGGNWHVSVASTRFV